MTIEERLDNYSWNVWALRAKRGWSQERLAEESGLTHVTISRIENKQKLDGRVSTLLALADTYGVGIDVLFGEKIEVLTPPYMRKKQ